MHNALRRELASLLAKDNIDLDPYFVKLALQRALTALGGPVQDARPTPDQQELIRDGRKPLQELSEPEPLPEGPHPTRIIPYHGLELFMRVKAVAGEWVLTSYDGVCDFNCCVVTNTGKLGPLVPHGPYHFCNDHFGALMDNLAKEAGQRVTESRPQLMERLASGPEDIGANILSERGCEGEDDDGA